MDGVIFSKTSPSACARIKAHTRTLGNAVNVTRPASFQAAARAYNQISLTWSKAAGVSGYQIYRRTSGGEYQKVETASWSDTSWTDTEGSAGNYVYIQDPCVQYGERYCKIFRLYRGSCG